MKKKETLLQFLTRRTGFGRTSWYEFAVIFGSVATMAWYALFGDPDELLARWVVGAFAVLVAMGVLWGTWRNYTGRQG